MQPVWMSMAVLLFGFLVIVAAIVAIVLVLTLRRRRSEQRGFEVRPVLPADEGKR